MPFPTHNPKGEYLDRWGAKGSEPGMLNGPTGIAFDCQRRPLRRGQHEQPRPGVHKDRRVPQGVGFTRQHPRESSTGPGASLSTATGDVYVADWGNHRVQKFAPDGEYLMTFGSTNGSSSSLSHPSGVAVDSDGDVYVTDWGNRRVQIFEPDGEVLTALYGDMRELSKGGAVRAGP